MLTAYGSSLTHSVCCVTPVLRGHPSWAAWLSRSHQSWWKAGCWPSTMTDWRGAQNSSPWIGAYRPGAGGWQGPAMRGLMNRFWHWAGDVCLCVCVCVCVRPSTPSGSQAPSSLQREPRDRLWLATASQKERRSSRSYTQKMSSLGVSQTLRPKYTPTNKPVFTLPQIHEHIPDNSAPPCTWSSPENISLRDGKHYSLLTWRITLCLWIQTLWLEFI